MLPSYSLLRQLTACFMALMTLPVAAFPATPSPTSGGTTTTDDWIEAYVTTPCTTTTATSTAELSTTTTTVLVSNTTVSEGVSTTTDDWIEVYISTPCTTTSTESFTTTTTISIPSTITTREGATTTDDWIAVNVSTPCTTTTTNSTSTTTTAKLSATTMTTEPMNKIESVTSSYVRHRNATISQIGEKCGGFMADAPTCAEGLICFHNRNPDFPGTCKKPLLSSEGGPCGGRSFYPPVCAPGLICVKVEDVPLANGTCQATASSQATLLPPTAIAPPAATGTETELAASISPVVSGEGGVCGGNTLNPPVCAPGLSCAHKSFNVDLPGVCVQLGLSSSSEIFNTTASVTTIATTFSTIPPNTKPTTITTSTAGLHRNPFFALNQTIPGSFANTGNFKDGCINVFIAAAYPLATSSNITFVAQRECGDTQPQARFARYFPGLISGALVLRSGIPANTNGQFEFEVASVGGLRRDLSNDTGAWRFVYDVAGLPEATSATETESVPAATALPGTKGLPGTLGAHCGGFLEMAPGCAPGLKCKLWRVPDVGGTCQYGEEEDVCGGGMENSLQCGIGLECVVEAPVLPGKSGTCKVVSGHVATETDFAPSATEVAPPAVTPVLNGLGGHCGGFIRNAPGCQPGLKCVLGLIPDTGGVCIYGEEGDACGGGTLYAIRCGPGLMCQVVPPVLMGKSGTCTVVASAATETEVAPGPATKTVNGLGGRCGGFIPNPPICAAGLICVHHRIGDFPGVCQHPGTQGVPCSSATEFGSTCAAGFTCVVSPPFVLGKAGRCDFSLRTRIPRPSATETEPTLPSTESVPVPPAVINSGPGGPCGGFIGNARQCAPGLACVYDSKVADAAGVCKLQGSVGTPCNVGTDFADPCAPGLNCVVEPPFWTGKEGTCGVILLSTKTDAATPTSKGCDALTVYLTKVVHDTVTVHNYETVYVTVTMPSVGIATTPNLAAQVTGMA
ncbi:hypothetical protein BC830DRAFT_1103156 [Chytriomyces sp. MP71]|nr:hypothetical protein BC830DRAFT_1103156 [Chytriomyces sp. MP71]